MPSKLDWLDKTHPIFDANKDLWEKNERRLRGGDEVLGELRRFDWEPEGSDQYKQRQAQATYINFPAQYADRIVGHLLRKAPAPDAGLSFGSLGIVARKRNLAKPTNAELVYYNADGVGGDGSQWDNFWGDMMRRGTATGHRWFFVDVPIGGATNKEQVLSGQRPYLVEYSPLSVPNWQFSQGRLDWAVVREARRNPVVKDGDMTGDKVDKPGYLLLVRAGIVALGAEYQAGGWWLYDEDKNPLKMGEGEQPFGDWTDTGGEIPMGVLYYQRDRGSRLTPAMSKPAITELGQCAVAHMNLGSAADFDAWDAAKSITWMIGASVEAFNLAMEKVKEGTRYVPVPPSPTGENIQIMDSSMGAVTAEVFSSRLNARREEAKELASNESIGGEDASGVSKNVSFLDSRAPRLASHASEMEQAQNTAIRWLEMRFGGASPSGSVVWTRDFTLIESTEATTGFLDAMREITVTDPDLIARSLILLAQKAGVITSDEQAQASLASLTAAAKDAGARLAAAANPTALGDRTAEIATA